MDVHAKLAEIRSSITDARAMPMSTSAVINRAELLAAVDELDGLLRNALGESDRVLADRDAVLQRARTEAADIVAAAEQERSTMVADHDVVAESQQAADELRRETDDYVDERLATFELTLTRTLEAVQRGRERLHHRSALDFGAARDTDDIVLPDHRS
ncbi:MAG: hypothetical protein H0U47_07085 [Nocardioidaceae bacterium]|nr:hypothetical protein [Nocardioidaceae bacterium]